MTGARVIRLNGCSSAPGLSIYQPQLLEKLLGVLDSPKVEEMLCDHWDTGHRRHQPVVRPELNRTVECR